MVPALKDFSLKRRMPRDYHHLLHIDILRVIGYFNNSLFRILIISSDAIP